MDIVTSKQNNKCYSIFNGLKTKIHKNAYISNNRESYCVTVSKTRDPRLRSEAFRQKVRRVFAHLNIENNQGNFQAWSKVLDWAAIDASIDHPTRLALHHTMDRNGNIIEITGRPEVLVSEIAACSESQASEILAKASKVFIRWWEPTRFDCGPAVMVTLGKELSNG